MRLIWAPSLIRATQEAAERLAGEARAGERERDQETAREAQALVALLQTLRDIVPPELWQQIRELIGKCQQRSVSPSLRLGQTVASSAVDALIHSPAIEEPERRSAFIRALRARYDFVRKSSPGGGSRERRGAR